jgi:hypothetical protein
MPSPWELEQPTPDLPEPIGPGPSPFWPRHLGDLFLRPTKFFSEHLALGRTPYVILVAWCLGMSAVIDRIDTRLMQAEVTGSEARWRALELMIGTWPHMWAFAARCDLLAATSAREVAFARLRLAARCAC